MATIICPKCGFEQPTSEECLRCGVIFAKLKASSRIVKNQGTQKDKSIEKWRKGLMVLWDGAPVSCEFTYKSSKNERTRRKVSIKQLLLGKNNKLYFYGFCHLRHERRTFNIANITTKILHKGKKWYVEDWIYDVLAPGIKPINAPIKYPLPEVSAAPGCLVLICIALFLFYWLKSCSH